MPDQSVSFPWGTVKDIIIEGYHSLPESSFAAVGFVVLTVTIGAVALGIVAKHRQTAEKLAQLQESYGTVNAFVASATDNVSSVLNAIQQDGLDQAAKVHLIQQAFDCLSSGSAPQAEGVGKLINEVKKSDSSTSRTTAVVILSIGLLVIVLCRALLGAAQRNQTGEQC
jgi:hypothetical protein